MITDSVSTNRVKKIVGRLSLALSYSEPTVSVIIQELDPQIRKWQEEKLTDHYTYLFTDTVYLYTREKHQVVSSPLLIITIGVDKNGHRKILGVDLALEESYQSYRHHFEKLETQRKRVKTSGFSYIR